ncbi:MAG: hypothetical protein HY272_09845 [Gammaproteobacteria bacterium]|nr:hypothetical protein [Gammaproteobacteria bacterium]
MTRGIRFSASFRARHPTKTAQEVVDQFGLQPDVMHSVGSQRMTPKGNLLNGVYERTSVLFPFDVEEYDSVEEFLLHMLDADFLKDEARLSEFVSTGGRLEFFLGIFCENNGGIEFDTDLMRRLAAKGVSLSLDIYGST